MALRPVKKLATKEFGNLDVESLLAKTQEAPGKRFFVGRIYGIARRQEIVTTTYGPSIKFVGEFRGDGWDGSELFASTCYLPDPIDQMLSSALNQAVGDGTDSKASVEFGFDIYTVPDKGVTGYKYITETLLNVAASDPMVALKGRFAPLQLAAPADEQGKLGLDEPETPEPEPEVPAATGKGGKKA